MSTLNKIRRAAAYILTPTPPHKGTAFPSMTAYNQAAQACAFFYEGIRQTRERSAIPKGPQDTVNLNNSFTRREFMDIARYLYANDGLTKGVINEVARYTVGPGRRPQALTDDEKINDQYEAYFRQWTYRADYYRKHHFNRLQFIWNTSEVRDGDVGIALVRDERGEPAVQTIRGHRIGNFAKDERALKSMKDGVVLDANDRVTGYCIRTGDGDGVVLPSQSFILYTEAEESDAVRGITKLCHAINHTRDKHDLLSSEKTAVKTLSRFAGVLKSGSGTVTEGEWNDDPQVAEPTKVSIAQMQEGILPAIKNDEEIIPFDFSRPSPTFTGFLEFLIREITYGCGLPFEFLWNPSALGGTAQRFILEKAQRRFNERQEHFDNAVLTRIWGFVIGDAIERGLLPFHPQWSLVSWGGLAWLSVDAGRDQAQDREDVISGLMSEATHAAMSGSDWRQRRNQIEREALDLIERADRIAKATGKDFDLVLALLRQTTPNGNPPEVKPEPKQPANKETKK